MESNTPRTRPGHGHHAPKARGSYVQKNRNVARRRARSAWQRPLAGATAMVTAIALGAVGLSGTLTPANAIPSDDSEALAELINLDALGLDAVDAITTESGNPSDPGPNSADIDASVLEGIVGINVGGVTLPLIGNGTAGSGLLDLGDNAAAGLLNGYASSPDFQSSVAASGAITGEGSINPDAIDGGPVATVDLTAPLEQLGLDGVTDEVVDQLGIQLGAIASRAEVTDGTAVDSEYLIADAQLAVSSPLVDDLSTDLDDTLIGVGGTVDAALGSEGTVGSLLGDLDIDLSVLGIGVDVSSGTIGVDGLDAALSELSNTLINEPLVDPNGIVSIDLNSGLISVDLAQLGGPEGLNGLDANTPLLDDEQIGLVTTAVSEALGSLTSKVTEGVTEVLNETSVTLDLSAQLSYLVNSTSAEILVDTTLGQLAGTDDTTEPAVEINTDGGVLDTILGLLGLSLEDLTDGLVTPLVDELLDVVGGTVGTLIDTIGDDLDTTLTGLIDPILASLSPLFSGLNDLVSITINEQPTAEPINGEGDLGDESFTVRPMAIDVLPGLASGVALDLASSTVRASDEPSNATSFEPAYAPTDAVPGESVDSEEPTFTDAEGDPATAPTGTEYALGDDAPDSASIDETTGVVTFTPALDDANTTVNVPVVVTYPDGSTDTTDAPFEVGDTNAGLFEPAYTDTDAFVGVEVTSEAPTFSDADGPVDEAPEGVEYALGDDAPDGATIDGATGAVTYTPTVDDADTTVDIPVVVTYDDGSTDEVDAPFVVATLADSFDPFYTDTDAEIGEEATSEDPTFTDSEGTEGLDAPEGTTFALTDEAPDGGSIDETTGAITYTPTLDDANDTVTFPVEVTYDDGSTDLVGANFQVGDTVASEFDPEYAPTQASPGVAAVSDSPDFGEDVTAPEVSYATGFDAPDSAEVDSETGEVTFTPALEDANTTVNIPVVVTYSDGSGDLIYAPFVVGDTSANLLDPAYAVTPAELGQEALSDEPTFTDADGAAEAPEGTSYELAEGAPENSAVDEATGVVSFTPFGEDAGQLVNIPVVVTYPDGSTDEVDAPFQVETIAEAIDVDYTETEANVGVEATSAPPTFSVDGEPGDGFPPGTSFALADDAPEGATVDAETGEVTWTPGIEDADSTVNIPVLVTYADESVDEVDAPFVVGVYNDNASASAAASADADDNSNASAEAAAEAAASADNETDASAAADATAAAAAEAAADEDASQDASADATTDPDASAAAAAEAAANADNSSNTAADASSAASANADSDATSEAAAAADAAATADSSTDASAEASADSDANTNASASASASADADDDSNASAEAAAEAAADEDNESDASAAADVTAAAAAEAAADEDASSDASADATTDPDASAAAAAEAAANADNSSDTAADASAAVTADADSDATAEAAAAADAAATADSSTDASAEASADADAAADDTADDTADATSASDADADADGDDGGSLPDTGAGLDTLFVVIALALMCLGLGLLLTGNRRSHVA
ncbi:YPDG domain-containing protein [Ruania suaedae]|uniref:Rib/alpha-like domain-containing protein n=1 Tax=Ruania suaedae TaxID=2897774 RepID=UPI001E571CD9|nr:Rib/alpha-like domain-containing protein [Ruania suaedae]UFU03547.1 YPDG domain-containing protein [Ruania suaedae]